MRNALAILLLIFFTSCENEYDFPLASKDLTVGPLYSYISNPILKVGDNDTDFDNKAISSPTVVAVENKLIMYYTALDNNVNYSIGRAESTDGIVWLKNERPVLLPDTENFQERIIKEPTAIYDGEKISLFFTSITKENKYRIMVAFSYDTLNFHRTDKELLTIPKSELKLTKISEPSVIFFNENYLMMYYTASDENGKSYIFSAKASIENPLLWTPESHNPIFLPQTAKPDAFDQYSVMSASVLSIQSSNNRTLYRMYYCGSSTETGAYHLGLAGSFDAIKFERYMYNPILHYGRSPSAIVFRGNLLVYYNELPLDESKGISLASTIKLK